MQIQSNTERWCDECSKVHFVNESLTLCPYCLQHFDEYLRLSEYNLSKHDTMYACNDCALFLHKEKLRSKLHYRLKELTQHV